MVNCKRNLIENRIKEDTKEHPGRSLAGCFLLPGAEDHFTISADQRPRKYRPTTIEFVVVDEDWDYLFKVKSTKNEQPIWKGEQTMTISSAVGLLAALIGSTATLLGAWAYFRSQHPPKRELFRVALVIIVIMVCILGVAVFIARATAIKINGTETLPVPTVPANPGNSNPGQPAGQPAGQPVAPSTVTPSPVPTSISTPTPSLSPTLAPSSSPSPASSPASKPTP